MKASELVTIVLAGVIIYLLLGGRTQQPDPAPVIYQQSPAAVTFVVPPTVQLPDYAATTSAILTQIAVSNPTAQPFPTMTPITGHSDGGGLASPNPWDSITPEAGQSGPWDNITPQSGTNP
jgi:hypothetical protein